jgi:hypothetical protein
MKMITKLAVLTITVIVVLLCLLSCKKGSNSPVPSLIVTPTVGATKTNFEINAKGCFDEEDEVEALMVRFDWENDGNWDTDWLIEKRHIRQFEKEGLLSVKMEIIDTDGNKTETIESVRITNSNHLVPTNSPFSYNVGINYETKDVGRVNKSIEKDLDLITQYFKLIKVYHTVDGSNPYKIEANLQELINYYNNNESKQLELVLGTNNNVLAAGGYVTPWEPGLMTNKSYTDTWVNMLTEAFGSKEKVRKYVRVILLGNEIDMNGPAPNNTYFKKYYSDWIPGAFKNLKESLSAYGLDEIPVTTTIANYPLNNPDDNVVSSASVKYIKNNWNTTWNNNESFVLFNHYTQNNQTSTDFGTVITYFENVNNILNGIPEVYVGETGYSAEYTETNEAKVINQVFSWLTSQYNHNKLSIPLFVFQGFDLHGKPKGEKMMGIFKDDSITHLPLGLKDKLSIPDWVKEKKN